MRIRDCRFKTVLHDKCTPPREYRLGEMVPLTRMRYPYLCTFSRILAFHEKFSCVPEDFHRDII